MNGAFIAESLIYEILCSVFGAARTAHYAAFCNLSNIGRGGSRVRVRQQLLTIA